MVTVSGYRAFPDIPNPAQARELSAGEFDRLDKSIVQEAPSLGEGHEGTVIWYAGSDGYVVEVKLARRVPVRMISLCTVAPRFGMDAIDGMFAQDVEEYILWRELKRPTARLAIYGSQTSVMPDAYLRNRGILSPPSNPPKKREWWKFW